MGESSQLASETGGQAHTASENRERVDGVRPRITGQCPMTGEKKLKEKILWRPLTATAAEQPP